MNFVNTLITILFCFTLSTYAQDKEGDLQLPVSNISDMQQQQEAIPTIDEVPMHQRKTGKTKIPQKRSRKVKTSKEK